MGSPMGSGGAAFVVRTRAGVWHLAPLLGDGARMVAVEALLDATGPPAEPDGSPDGLAGAVTPVAPDSVVRPAPTWVGELVDGGVRVALSRPGLLTPMDLRLLDAVGERAAVGALAAESAMPPEEVGARIARLVVLGVLRVDVPDALPTPSEDRPATGPPSSGPLSSVPRSFVGRSSAGAAVPPDGSRAAATPGHRAATGERIPVYAVWHHDSGPLLSLGMLTAAARAAHGGALAERFEIRRPEPADVVLADLAARSGPAVLLCSDYLWTIRQNLETAQAARALCPELLVVHGGPSSPKYEAEAERFLRDHAAAADVLVREEGEHTIVELLDRLDASSPRSGIAELEGIAGVTYADPATGRVVRTPDRPRIADLDALPSPYLTGEFDDIAPEAWTYCIPVETNRGCPYGCTFCDWGSATLSRIRKFDLDRVAAELAWAAERRPRLIYVTDSNFGIMARDVQTVERLVEIRRRTGHPTELAFCPAKNTARHLDRIMEMLDDAGIAAGGSIALQTTDEATLEAIDRSNISIDSYLALAARFRSKRLPVQGDLLLGLPEQTYESYGRDLQFMLDHEIQPRTWPVQLLPNAPMNDPEYRERYGITASSGDLVRSTASFDETDRARMLRLRKVDTIAEQFGLLRHVMRFVQWDHGITATALMDRIIALVDEDPLRYPWVTWVVEHYDLFPGAIVDWAAFYEQVGELLVRELQVPDGSALRSVLELQRFLMPAPGRRFPGSVHLDHDYLAYYREATASLHTTGHAGVPTRPLEAYTPGSFTVDGDPIGLCRWGVRVDGDARDERMQGDLYIGSGWSYELSSPLMRLRPGGPRPDRADHDRSARSIGSDGGGRTTRDAPIAQDRARPVAVTLVPRR